MWAANLKVSLDGRVGDDFLALLFDEDIEQRHLPSIRGRQQAGRSFGRTGQRQQVGSQRFAVLGRFAQIPGTLLLLFSRPKMKN